MTIVTRRLFGLTVLVFWNQTFGWRPYRVHNVNITAYSLSDKISGNASINKDNSISLYINIKENLVRPFAKFEFYVDSGDGLFALSYINQTIDLCRFFRDKKFLPLIQLLYKLIVEKSNYPTSCPIKKKLYAAVNYKENVEKFPPVMPEKQFSFGFTVYSLEGSALEPLFIYKLYVKIMKN